MIIFFLLLQKFKMLKIMLLFMYGAILAGRYVTSASIDQACTCAIMNGDTVDAPVLEQTFNIAFTCDEEGKQTCRNLCVSLAEAAKSSGTGSLMLCEHIEEDTEIYVTVFSKVCDFPYAHSGLAYTNHLCCIDRKPGACKGE
uniref:Uncharacterized protein n=1 Tax=Rhodnius prolixus TaxID=13249 RepID=T1IEW5_RHOPR